MKKFLSLLIVPVLATVGFVATTQSANATLIVDNPIVNPVDDGGTQNLQVLGGGAGQQDALINVIRGFINWTLGILAFIALIILLYGGFLMVTAAGDEEKYKKGFTILRQAAIGLILIGVAWFIISLIFRLVNLVGQSSVGTSGGSA